MNRSASASSTTTNTTTSYNTVGLTGEEAAQTLQVFSLAGQQSLDTIAGAVNGLVGAAQSTAQSELQTAQAIAVNAAPAATETTSSNKTILYVVLGIGAILALFLFMRK